MTFLNKVINRQVVNIFFFVLVSLYKRLGWYISLHIMLVQGHEMNEAMKALFNSDFGQAKRILQK